MTARDDFPNVASMEQSHIRRGYSTAAQFTELLDELDRLRAVMDEELSFKELELKIRPKDDGTGYTSDLSLKNPPTPHMRMFAAMCWHFIMGEDNTEPANYRSSIVEQTEPKFDRVELKHKPPGEWNPIRVYVEVIKPGGKSSHEIRTELESRLARLEQAAP